MARQRDPLTIKVYADQLVLDLGAVTYINSIGVREWCRMQSEAVAARVRVELRRVVEVMVNQLNIVKAARGNSIVTSFYAPYICNRCDRDDAVLLDVTINGKDIARRRPPARECPECGDAMEFGHPPELYFTFLG